MKLDMSQSTNEPTRKKLTAANDKHCENREIPFEYQNCKIPHLGRGHMRNENYLCDEKLEIKIKKISRKIA